MCCAFYQFKRDGDKILVERKWFRGKNDIPHIQPVFCEIYDDINPDPDESKKVADIREGNIREATIAGMTQGGAFCYCELWDTCNAEAHSFRGYVESKHPEERRVLEYFRTLYVPELEALLGGTPSVRPRPDPSVSTSMAPKGKNGKLNGQGTESGRSKTFIVIVGAVCGVFVLLAVIILACAPFIIKYRRAKRKKWLEQTWDMRVRQAALELEQQTAEQENKKKRGKRRRGERVGSAEASKDGSKENSKEQGSKEKSKEQGSKEKCGSKEGPGSGEPIVSMPLFLKEGEDPFGSRESKYVPFNEPGKNQPPGPPAPQKGQGGFAKP